MLYSYKYLRNEPLELMELYCYFYGSKLRDMDNYKHELDWLGKAIKICKERIKRRMHD